MQNYYYKSSFKTLLITTPPYTYAENVKSAFMKVVRAAHCTGGGFQFTVVVGDIAASCT